ncbi:16S rRNA (cytosine(1402)-N(4))-methyltransferase RsmH [Anaeromyxobacter paludicola]|uniref:Ribosomal RNA small subunit methyltransferase H n=1 Tax=Anaeromyxobacter paludicola TaxID=2918171 RepID=A0ABM7XEK9_9BACT|nr:16S rRNA (cytosine(1402)-N(4))-methyltransferase RsmH [Anaeromyxobacter paludicola]BDG10313.1 ribosomal RNA small subunit methyltransferase H [Anaeromyxobacter paludicola]
MSAEFHHVTVLANETVELLAPAPGKLILDGTLGGGGHSELLLSRGARVIGVDKDPAALAAARARLARYGEAFRAVRGDFRDARNVLDALGIGGVDGALVDLGVSSPQLDEAERGFSFSRPGPLDMRMGQEGETVADLLARIDEAELARILREYGEEPFARPIARAVKRAVAAGDRLDTAGLAEVVARAVPRKAWPKRIHPATRTFQALRIAVNDELGALAAWLGALPATLAVGGRAAVISFHSLEDRMVKERFRELTRGCTCPPGLPVCACGADPAFRAVTRKAVKASEDEVAANPRSRSARLRAVERLR